MVLGTFLLTLTNLTNVQAVVGDPVGGVGVGLGKKPNPAASVTTGVAGRAISTKGISGAIVAGGDVTDTNTDTTTISNSPTNVKVTNSETTTTSSSPNVKDGVSSRDGVNTVSNTRLDSLVSGNAVVINPFGDTATPVSAVGNTVGGNAFSGATGITVNNMSSGHNSSIQSAVTVTARPPER